MVPLGFLWCILTTILYLSSPTLSQQCLVVYLTVDIIEPGLDPLDWEGTYTTDGSTTTSGCLSYTTPQGTTLQYHAGAWSVRSLDNEFISYETTASSPCNPPLTTDFWQHGVDVNESTITITCSYSSSPTSEPTTNPTYVPTSNPITYTPTMNPTLQPTQNPTQIPSQNPTLEPTYYPTTIPTVQPTPAPTENPTPAPTTYPTAAPSFAPVSAPTIAPTQDCSRIVLLVKSPLGEVPSHIDGIYYQADYIWPTSGYPWYQQYKSGTENNQQATNQVSIIFKDYWTIIDVTNGIELQYQLTFTDPTLHVPPHTPIIGDEWTVIGAPPNTDWAILIKCTSITHNPTTSPTFEPTIEPTIFPTFDPTYVPTQPQPTFFPTSDPIVSTYSTLGDNAGTEASSFLDTFTIVEWLIIASLPLICCLVIASLWIWKNKRVQKYKDADAAHLLSAKSTSVDMVQVSPKRKANLDFTRHAKKSTADLEADFADALAVVSKHKSQKSLNAANEKVNQTGYKMVDARSPDETMIITAPASHHVTHSDEPLVGKSDSEFYGNHPIDEIYSYTFITKPFGMEWKTTKTDKKNLYVSKVQKGSQAALGNVRVGSKLISFNGEMIEHLGAKNIYGKLAISDMPLTITFLKPFKKEEDKEGDNYAAESPPPMMPPPNPQMDVDQNDHVSPPTPPPNVAPEYAADAGVASDDLDNPLIPPKVPLMPPKVPSIAYDEEDEVDPFAEIGPPPVPVMNGTNQRNDTIMDKAQALIPEVFEDDEEMNPEESFHAD